MIIFIVIKHTNIILTCIFIYSKPYGLLMNVIQTNFYSNHRHFFFHFFCRIFYLILCVFGKQLPFKAICYSRGIKFFRIDILIINSIEILMINSHLIRNVNIFR